MAFKWYVVHTYSGFENKVKMSLQERIELAGAQAYFSDILIPEEDVVELISGEKKTSKRKFFPGYILVRMEMNDENWHIVKNTPKVTVSWDFGWNEELVVRPGFAPLLEQIDFLFLNESEARLYGSGLDWSDRPGVTVIKLGKQGCLAWSGKRKTAVGGLAVKAIDSTGAGDAFNGGFLAGMLAGHSLSDSLKLGNRIGAASTLCAGGLAGLPRA